MIETMNVDVAVIGSGPAGLAAAIELKKQGIARVVVIERETQAGGIPRHCNHYPYGVLEYKSLMKGPEFAKRNVTHAIKLGVDILTRSTVTKLLPQGVLEVMTPDGAFNIDASRVLIATGVRETPRSARLIGGDRPIGVINTGALQSYIHLKGKKPFKRPVIVGTELVSLSAIATCLEVKIKPVAMIDSQARATVRQPFMLYPKMCNVPVLYNAKLLSINGRPRVESVTIQDADGSEREIKCDGVILTGQFVPDTAILRTSHLVLDNGTGGPQIDQCGRCSDPSYFAAGNLLRAVETAGWSYREGRAIGRIIANDLIGQSASGDSYQVAVSAPFKYCVPQRLSASPQGAMTSLQLRVNQPVKGQLEVVCGSEVIYSRTICSRPERRILIPIDKVLGQNNAQGTLQIRIAGHDRS